MKYDFSEKKLLRRDVAASNLMVGVATDELHRVHFGSENADIKYRAKKLGTQRPASCFNLQFP